MRLWHYRQKHAGPKMTTQQVLCLEILEATDPRQLMPPETELRAVNAWKAHE